MSRERRRQDREQGEILLDKYIILKTLHSAKSSEVFLVKNIGLENQRIIKRFACNNLGEDNFRREASVLGSLKHSGIPIIYETVEDDKAYYIIEEFIEGDNLFDYVKKYGVLTEDMAIDIGVQISEIIHFLHNREPVGIWHLDLKPQNIIMKGKKVYLIDFGNSMFADSSRKYMSGTKGFAAPEQYTLDNVGAATDVYGIGAMLYFMVTGNTYENEKDTITDIDFYVSEEFKQIIIRCLLPKEARIGDAFWVAENLKKINQEKIRKKDYEIIQKDLMENPLNKVINKIGRRNKHIKKKSEKGFLDSLQGKFSVKTIGILGSCRGDGATTLSIAMANYLAEVMQKKTAIIECNDSKTFEIMLDALQGDREEHSYMIGKVHYFYGLDLSAFFATYANEYEYIVIDFGNSVKEFKNNILKLKHKIILGSVMPYKNEYHSLAMKSVDGFIANEEILHLLSGDGKSVKDYALKHKINALPAPIIVNPYIIESKLKNFFQLLF